MAGLKSTIEDAIVAMLVMAARGRTASPGRPASETPEGGFVIGTSVPFSLSGDGPVGPVVVGDGQLRRHVALFGGSGMGKSTLLRRLRLHAYRSAWAVMDLDFSGDSTDLELRRLAAMGAEAPDVALIDLRQGEYVARLNPLAGAGTAHARATAVLSAMRSESEVGVRVAYNAFAGLVALAEAGYGLTELRPLFSAEPGFRALVLSTLADESARAVLRDFDRIAPDVQRAQWMEIANKLPLLSHPEARLTLGQDGFLDLPSLLDREGSATLVAIGAARQPAAGLVAKSILSAVERHVMARADAPEERRQKTLLVVDEASRVAGFGLESLLAEGRRMGCSVALAMQHTHQAEPALRAAIRANASLQVYFAAGAEEAAALAPEIVTGAPRERVRDELVSLKVGEAIVVRRGGGDPPVKVRLLDSPAPEADAAAVAELRERALARTGLRRADAEALLRSRAEWIEGLDATSGTPGEVVHLKRPRRRKAGG